MSKLFNDPEYKRMQESDDSWLELAIEPYRFPLNDILLGLESEISIKFNDINNMILGNTNNHVDVWSILRYKYPDLNLRLHAEKYYICSLYELIIEPDTYVDFKSRTLNNPIVIRKTKDMFSDEEIPGV